MDTTPKSEDKSTGEDKPRGINWLSILGIAVLVILIFLVIWAVMIMNITKENPLAKDVIALEPQIEEMMNLTLSQIEQRAEVLDAEEVAKNAEGYKDRFLIVEGTMSREESIGVAENIALNIFSDNPLYKPYILSDAVVAIDITGESDEAPEGAFLRAYGKLLVLNIQDVWALPIVGPNLKQEFGDVEGMAPKVVFLISRGVEIAALPPDVEEEPLPGEMGSEARTPEMDGAGEDEAAADESMTDGEAEEEAGAEEAEDETGEAEEPEAEEDAAA